MKKLNILVGGLLFILFASFVPGNSCESFFPNKVGTKWEMSNYNEKNKLLSVSKSELKNVQDISGGIEATINQEIYDDKEKLLHSGDVKMRCTGESFYMDISNMMGPNQMEGMEGVEVEMSNEFMEFPSHPTAGQKLPDITSTMTVKMNGMQVSSTTITVTNRMVEGSETITTPAGTFDCYKFSEDSEVKSMMMKFKSHTIMWMAKNVGSVRIESYDDKGKLQSTNILTSFSE